MYTKSTLYVLLAALFAGALATTSKAAIFTFNFDTIVTGSDPSGSSIATLTIADSGVDSVLITLEHNATSGTGQFITDLYLNLNPFTAVTQSGQTPPGKFNGGLLSGLNTEQDAGLNFDLHQNFETSNSGGGVNRLKPGESVSFSLTGSGLSASQFVSTALPTGGQRTDVFAMIHLQGLPNGQSVKLGAVPEPGSILVVASGLALLRRRRRKLS